MSLPTTDDFSSNCTLILLSLPYDVKNSDIIYTFQEDATSIEDIQVEGPLAYVVFRNHATPLKIHQTRTFYKVKGKSIKICWKLSKEEISNEEFNYDFFDLKPEATDESVQVCLNAYAQIKSLLFTHSSRGVFSVIKFSSSQDVENVFDNISEIKEKIGSDNFSVKKHEKKAEKCSNVLVKNIHPALIANSEFLEFFKSFGNIESFKLTPVNPEFDAKALYVEYTEENDAKRLIEEVDGKDVFDCDMPLSASLLRSKKEMKGEKNKTYYEKRKVVENDLKDNNVFVKNIRQELGDLENFKEYFMKFGGIFSCKVVPEKKYGFVCFNEHDDAVKCVNAKHGRMYVKFKESKKDTDIAEWVNKPF
ncbi:polyadenylate-binding protein, cytoplasmic and nuclear, putative [Entamoeba invadens IP1]|uniref:Polyadenylate-binding protein, cytoplasmic and nuclear, putative n=1 Tax=Entamoeba invadens IP1 TaxID=370355 RepID=A0A0A1UCW2_ENTIV|nr:polyadenylate-binding protein, cytoplasmic and nuclear, putative [Entamoeba invadens IP1]ELP91513.1 polyadenylate-binding protein, cytoplasmic and nuclear, putative [Entamoeba invadens IP1]|eukprot:XP_004258284.1 polyadenylate-binding protein, cytoplasmic and nuclear, putative [Entamoeba invadens IP1]